jgi:hypothetical protein
MEQGGAEGDRAVLVTLMQKRERQERDRGRNGMKNPHPALDLAGACMMVKQGLWFSLPSVAPGGFFIDSPHPEADVPPRVVTVAVELVQLPAVHPAVLVAGATAVAVRVIL